MPSLRRAFRFDSRVAGALLCSLGTAALTAPSLLAAALGIESVAAAFWLWARSAPGAWEQVSRWAWLRRPATALWLAVAIHAMLPGLGHADTLVGGALEMLRWAEAIAIVWAGLELMAALPLARPYSDLPGPLRDTGPWLPVLLPAAGFVLLWRHSAHWIEVEPVRHVAVPLLLFTGVLGALRAFSRRQWTASLRWLAVSDSALATLLIAYRTVSPTAALLLWLGACGGHALLLAGEMRGATTRRGPLNTRLWRAASWTAFASLSWPALLASGIGPSGWLRFVAIVAAALTAVTTAWITVGRMVAAPERRRMTRLDPTLTLSLLSAVGVLAIGPAALLIAWWHGFEPPWQESLAALVPVVVGGAAALAARGHRATPFWRIATRLGEVTPRLAHRAYRLVVDVERRLVGLGRRAVGALASPLHDLHTGDAQEYLLFLVGIGILALVLPLLQ